MHLIFDDVNVRFKSDWFTKFFREGWSVRLVFQQGFSHTHTNFKENTHAQTLKKANQPPGYSTVYHRWLVITRQYPAVQWKRSAGTFSVGYRSTPVSVFSEVHWSKQGAFGQRQLHVAVCWLPSPNHWFDPTTFAHFSQVCLLFL